MSAVEDFLDQVHGPLRLKVWKHDPDLHEPDGPGWVVSANVGGLKRGWSASGAGDSLEDAFVETMNNLLEELPDE